MKAMSRLIDKVPTTIWWYLSCAGIAAYFFIGSGDWWLIGGVFFLYIIGWILSAVEYNRGAREAVKAQNEALEKIIAEQKEWWDNYHAEKESETWIHRTDNGYAPGRLPRTDSTAAA